MDTETLCPIRMADEPGAIASAADILHGGGLVVFPTETVYGLGAEATNDRAIARLFAAKGRPRFNPLIVHVADARETEQYAVFDHRARRLAERFWPGALTLVLPRAPNCSISRLASAGLATIAVRVPSHPIAAQLLGIAKRPIAAPSANPSGALSATHASDIARALRVKVDLILDGGPSRLGLESTIVGLTGTTPTLLRPGAIAREEIEAAIGMLADPETGTVSAPGQLASHYAPRAHLRLNAKKPAPDEAFLAFGSARAAGAVHYANLSESGDLVEAAANLFAMLHALDDSGAPTIAVAPIPETGLGEAINDRLRRAAAPRNAS